MGAGPRHRHVAGHVPRLADPPYGNGWHIEGNTFRHHLASPEQAVLSLFYFSTVEPAGGGTVVIEGSHHLAAQLLRDSEPEGLPAEELGRRLTAALDETGWPGAVEVVADEGAVVLGHPLLFHSPNPNHGVRPRVMAQPQYSMTEPKRTHGGGLHPVEIPLARACAQQTA